MPRRRSFALLLGIVVLNNGCGGDSPSSAPAPSVPATPVPTPNRAPTAVGTLEDRSLTAGASPTTVDVATGFSDPGGDTLSYSVASSDPGVVRAEISGGVVTLTPVAAGTATVTVTATDPGGLSATHSFGVTVQAAEAVNRAPTAVGTIAEQALTAGADPITVDVASGFSDPDDDTLSYSVASSDLDVVRAEVSGSVVTLTPVAAGTATVTVTATDPGGLSAAHDFEVRVQPPAVTGRMGRIVQPYDEGTESFECTDLDVFLPFAERFLEAVEQGLFPQEDSAFALQDAADWAELTDLLAEVTRASYLASETNQCAGLVEASEDFFFDFLFPRVARGEAGFFAVEAPIEWNGASREVPVVIRVEGEDPTETTLEIIQVWGTPGTGKPLRPAERSQWWVLMDDTTFGAGALARGSAAEGFLAPLPILQQRLTATNRP